ncbi:MAG: HAMP domain-containing protein [Zoogloeaceae bacterium]|nr:HAMP domain-containing protein [Zoogloeaceae bacterium]
MRSFFSLLRNGYARSMTWRLVVHIVFFQTLILGVFIAYLVHQETAFLRQIASHNAVVMAQSIAANARTWMLSRDAARMDGLVHSFDDFPNLEVAMLLDSQGKILAHIRSEEVGSRLPEELTQKLSGKSFNVLILNQNDHVIDVAAPVVEGGALLGWSRLALRQVETNVVAQEILNQAIRYVVTIFFLSIAFAWWLATKLTRDIIALSDLSNAVTLGERRQRLYLNREDELGRLAKDFNQMLDTLEKQESRLKIHARALGRSNAELERFAYIASHDLQEPLRMVASYVQLLGRRYKGKLDEDADDFIGFAVDGANRMQQLINDLLMYSRVDSKGGEIRPANLDETLDRALFSLQMTLTEQGATIERVPLPNLPADASQIAQLWQNLIGNALKFRGEAPPVIRIGATEGEDNWRFSVRDNGIGVEAGQEERIFQIFQRLHTRESYPGTGIGLSICKRIIERHGGTIGVASRHGEGSEFWFTLPKVAKQREDIDA